MSSNFEFDVREFDVLKFDVRELEVATQIAVVTGGRTVKEEG